MDVCGLFLLTVFIGVKTTRPSNVAAWIQWLPSGTAGPRLDWNSPLHCEEGGTELPGLDFKRNARCTEKSKLFLHHLSQPLFLTRTQDKRIFY